MANHAKHEQRPSEHEPSKHGTEQVRNDPHRATDAERRSGGSDDRSRHDPDRAYDAERRPGGDPKSQKPQANNPPR